MPVYVRGGRRIRRYTAKEQQERILGLVKRKPRTAKQLAKSINRSIDRTKLYLRKIQRSNKLRAQGARLQRINGYWHYVPKAEARREVAPKKKEELYVFRAAFNSGTGPVNLEIDIAVVFRRNLAVSEDQDHELLRVRNEIEEAVRRKFGKQFVYSPNFRAAPVPLKAGESTTDRWRYRHNGGSWNYF